MLQICTALNKSELKNKPPSTTKNNYKIVYKTMPLFQKMFPVVTFNYKKQ